MGALLLLFFSLVTLLACDAPGPLKADRDAEDLFGPSEDNTVVVDAILIVDAPLPHVDLRITVAPGLAYLAAATALSGAEVSIQTADAVFDYLPNQSTPGRYLPPDGAPPVAPASTYELSVISTGHPEIRATTQTPPRMRISEFVLLDDDLEKELRRLRLFDDIGDDVYHAPENQLEYTVGALQVRLQLAGDAASYQFGVQNLENTSPLLFDSDLISDEDVEDLERLETSPLLRLDEAALYLPWQGIFYAGRHKVKLFAVDQNWFDLVRTDNVDADRGAGEAGQGFQRPLFNIENGIGLFASASVDSVGFFVRPEGAPPCTGCECWGCGDRSSWSGTIDTETGDGRIRFERDVGTGATCELSYEITGAVPVEPCGSCSFAWEFELGKLTVYRDKGACDEARDLRGTLFRFAQGNEIVMDDEGAQRYGLYIEEEGVWGAIETGWSLVLASDSVQRWLFGFAED